MANPFKQIAKIPELVVKAAVLREKFILLRDKYRDDPEIKSFCTEADELLKEISSFKL